MHSEDDFFYLEDDVEERRRKRERERKKAQLRKKARRRKAIFIIICFVLILAIVFVGYSSCVKMKFNSIDAPQFKSSTESEVTVTWEKIGSAEGYNLYSLDEKNAKTLVKKVEGTETTEATVKQEQATIVYFAVAPYKDAGQTEGTLSEKIAACTLPSKQAVSVFSPKKQMLSIMFQENKKASGYEVQYGKDAQFKDAQTKTLEGNTTVQVDLEGLNAGDVYYARARSYLNFDNEKKYGEWSNSSPGVEIIEEETIDPSKPMIALTFDDGPGGDDSSDRIVDVLEKYNARATFFMVGNNAESHPENVRRKKKIHCELGNHTYDHTAYGKDVTPDSIRKCSDAIEKITGHRPTCFRSTGGMTTDGILRECANQGMPLFFWSVDTQDWKTRNADAIYGHVMSHASDGDIVLMHEIYSTTADAVERLVPELLSQGYQLVTVSELIRSKTDRPPVPGREYITADQLTSVSS